MTDPGPMFPWVGQVCECRCHRTAADVMCRCEDCGEGLGDD